MDGMSAKPSYPFQANMLALMRNTKTLFSPTLMASAFRLRAAMCTEVVEVLRMTVFIFSVTTTHD